MGNEAAASLVLEHTKHGYAYETIDTTEAIVHSIKAITTRIEQVALVCITLSFDHDSKVGSHRSAAVNHSLNALLTSLRSLVRKTDKVFLLHTSFYFVLLGANQDGGQIVQERLWDALLWQTHNTLDRDILRPRSMTIGHSAYSVTSDLTIENCIKAATESRLYNDVSTDKPVRKTGGKPVEITEVEPEEAELPIIARKLGIPYLSLLPRKAPSRLKQLVSPRLAQELHCYPIGKERNTLTVAMANPEDLSAVVRLEQETGLHIFPVLTHPEELQTALEQML